MLPSLVNQFISTDQGDLAGLHHRADRGVVHRRADQHAGVHARRRRSTCCWASPTSCCASGCRAWRTCSSGAWRAAPSAARAARRPRPVHRVHRMIQFNNVNKWYGEYHALVDVSETIAKGEVVVVCGPSGSGKSTLIRTINRLEEIDSGTITVDGEDIHRARRRREPAALAHRLRVPAVQPVPAPERAGELHAGAGGARRRAARAGAPEGDGSCSTAWASRTRPAPGRRSSRAASSSAWRSRGRSRWSRR